MEHPFQILYACSHIVAFPDQRPYGHWSGSETSAHVKSSVNQYSSEYTWLAQSLPIVVDKGYGHHKGKALHSATY